MAHLLRHGVQIAATAAVIALAAAGCSDDKGDDNGNGGGNSGNSGSGAFAATGGGANSSGSSGSSGTSGGGGSANASGTSGGGGSANSGGGGSSGSSGTAGAGNVPACAGLPLGDSGAAGAGEVCTGAGGEAEPIAVDMFIMMDRSVSMITNCIGGAADMTGECAGSMTRWAAVEAAVQAFVSDPRAAGIRMGIQFFGASIGQPNDAVDCDVSNYSTAAVDIGDIATVGQDIADAVTGVQLGGITPMLPALQGALAYATDWQQANPTRATVVVLVTDGYPTQCGTSIADVAAVAGEAYNASPSIRTYVVGVAADLNLGAIAMNGGTRMPYIVDTENATDAFVNALLNISNSALACEYEIPPSPDPTQQLDYDKVQVIYTPGTGEPQEIPRARSFADCADSDAGGWYYNSTANPTKILVCPCTCSNFGAGQVEVRLGCEPRPIIIE